VLVEAVSDRIDQTMPAIPGATLKARVAAANQLVAAKNPADLPRLMRLLPDVKIADATELAKQLDVYLPDPRYLRHVVELLRAQPWGSSTSRGLWSALFAHLAKYPDPRAFDQLATIDLATVDSDYGREQMRERIEKLRAKLKPQKIADPAGLEPLEAALADSGAQGGDLIETIRANPGDLSVRAIYADWLTERGDPRGELITLQLAQDPTEDQRRRERALLAERAAEWLGPIAPALVDGFTTFRNGFLAAARVDLARALKLLDAAEWATLEELWLSVDEEPFPVTLIDAPALRGLRFVAGVWPHQLRDLETVTRPLAGIGLKMPENADGRDLVGKIARPTITELAFDRLGPNGLAWLWETPLAARITRVRTSSGLGSLPAWIADDRVPATLATLQISFNHGWHAWTAELSRGSDGRFSRVTATLRPSIKSFRTSKVLDLLEDVFDELKPDALEEFTLRLDGTSATKADLAKLGEALARQTRLARSSLPGDVAVPKTVGPVKTVKAARAEAAVAKASDARGELAKALDALADPSSAEVLRALDYADEATWKAARTVLRKQKAPLSSTWVDVCFAILALPGGSSDGGATIHEAIVELLGATAPAGALARTTHLLEQGLSYVLQQDLSLIPTAELSGLFDWFEKRRGDKAPPRADRIYGAIRAVAALRGTKATRQELERRLATKPMRFVAWAYENAIRDLADR